MKPKRLTAETEYTHELGASVADIENQLRINLMASMRNKMSDILVNGTAPTQQNPERIEGFLAELTDPSAPSAVAKYADYGSLHAKGVDGIHAEMETQVSGLLGIETYQHAATVYQAGSGESGTEALKAQEHELRRERAYPGSGEQRAAGDPPRRGAERRRNHARR